MRWFSRTRRAHRALVSGSAVAAMAVALGSCVVDVPEGISPSPVPAGTSEVMVHASGLKPNGAYWVAQCVEQLCGTRKIVSLASDGVLSGLRFPVADSFRGTTADGRRSMSLWCVPAPFGPPCEVRILDDPASNWGVKAFPLTFETSSSSLTLSRSTGLLATDEIEVSTTGLQAGQTYTVHECLGTQCRPETVRATAEADGSFRTRLPVRSMFPTPRLSDGQPVTYGCAPDGTAYTPCYVRLSGPGPLPAIAPITFAL